MDVLLILYHLVDATVYVILLQHCYGCICEYLDVVISIVYLLLQSASSCQLGCGYADSHLNSNSSKL